MANALDVLRDRLLAKSDDTAIIEQQFGGGWVPVARIGPSREDFYIPAEALHYGGSIRVRYLVPEDSGNLEGTPHDQ